LDQELRRVLEPKSNAVDRLVQRALGGRAADYRAGQSKWLVLKVAAFGIITVAAGFILLQWWNTSKQGNTLANAPITISNSTGRVVLYHRPRGAADRSRIITGSVHRPIAYAIFNRGTVIASTNPGGRPKHLILGGGS
jgi:hypothetical protein